MAVRYIPTGGVTRNVNGNTAERIAKLVHDEPVTIQLTSAPDFDALRGVVFASATVIDRVLFRLKNVGQGAGLWRLYGCNDFDQYPNHTLTELATVGFQTSYGSFYSGFGYDWVVCDFQNATPFKWYFIGISSAIAPIQTATVIAWQFWNMLDIPVDIGDTGETQSYDNLGGSGLRAGPIPGTNGFAFDAAYRSSIFTLDHNYPAANGVHVMYLMLDGRKSSNGLYAWSPNRGVSGGIVVTDKWIKFSLRGQKRKITKARLYFAQTSGQAFGSHKWQGSNDAINWLDLTGSIAVTVPASGPLEFVFDQNIDHYKHYRMIGVSGNAGDTVYIGEVEFEISGVPYEKGDRRADITASSNISPGGFFDYGTPANLFDGAFTTFNPTAAYTWYDPTSAAGKYFRWSFPKPVLLASLFWQSGAGATIGTPTSDLVMGLWDLYGSDDDSNWHALANNIDRQKYGNVFVDMSANTTRYQHYKLVPQGPSITHSYRLFDNNVMAEFQFDIVPTSSLEVTFRDEASLSVEGPVQSLNLQTRFYDEGQLTLDSDALVIEEGTGTFFAVTFTDESKLSITPKIVGGTSGGSPANVQVVVNHS